MSDNEQQGNDQGQDGGGIAELRKQYEDTRAELKALKQERRQRAYVDAGIPEGARDLFDTAYNGELTVEALREFGQSKGFALSDLGNDGNTVQPQERQVEQQGQSRLDAVDAARLPNDQPSIENQIVEAANAGDWEKSRALKHQLLDQRNKARRDAGAAI